MMINLFTDFKALLFKIYLIFRLGFKTQRPLLCKKNYRSAQNILDAAFASVAKNLERIDPDKSLTAAGDNQEFPGDIWQFEFGSF